MVHRGVEMTMSIREHHVWASIVDAYYAWNNAKHESQMMPVRLLSQNFGRRILAEEIVTVLDKGVVARLIELQIGQEDTFFCPLHSQPKQPDLFSNCS